MAPQQQKFAMHNFVADVGRLVGGSLTVPSTKGYKGEVREKPQYFIMVAVRKDSPNINAVLGGIMQHAMTSYQGIQGTQVMLQRIQTQPFQAPTGTFAWKIDDGDAPDECTKPGRAGCWLFKYTTEFPIQVCDENNRQIDPNLIPLGSYVAVAASTRINGATDHTAGMFLNPQFVKVLKVATADEVISTGPSADQIFSGHNFQLPPGVAPAAPQQYGQPAPQQQQWQQQVPAPQQQQWQQPAAPFGPGGAVNGPGVPAGAMPPPPALPTGQPGSAATAYPSNVQPHHAFANYR